MKYFGTVIEESLETQEGLADLKVVKREVRPITNAADFQPTTWTVLSFENDDDRLAEVVAALSRSLKPRWYTDLTCDGTKYIVFRDRIFTYGPEEVAVKAEAIRYGRSIGIPDSQLDWPD